MVVRHKNNGFTLLELLVALSIFSLVGVTVYSNLSSMLETREHLQLVGRNLQELQSAFMLMSRDFEQAVDRPIRTEYGEEQSAMLWSERHEFLAITRNGRRNPARMPRSSLQRISYRLDEERLLRESWPVLDRGVDTIPFTQVLLAEVLEFQVSFIGDNDKVSRSWPPLNPGFGSDNQALPRAIRIQLEVENWGKIDRLFVIGRTA